MFVSHGELDFTLLPESDETRAFAEKIAAVYPDRLCKIADFLLADEGFRTFFSGVTQSDIISGLGRPIFTLLSKTDGVVTFPELEFGDKGHLVSFEFSGELSEFYYLSIDG